MNHQNQQPVLSIGWDMILKIAVGVVCLYVLFLVKNIIIWFIFAVIISILFNFVIDILERKRVPRVLATVGLYLVIFALLGFFVYRTTPVLINEFQDFAKSFPEYLRRISPVFEKFGVEVFKNTDVFFQAIQTNLDKASGSIIDALFSIFGGASSTVLVLAMAFFISLQKNLIEKFLTAFSPSRYKKYVFSLWGRAKRKVSGWFITRLIGVVFVGATTYLVLSILDVKYAFVLSLMAGLFDLVPFIGPAVAGVMIFFITSLTSLWQAVFAGALFVVIQQLENNLLFPILFKKFIGLSPILVLIALAVGGRLWGIAGAILAIPLAGIIFEVIKDYLARVKGRQVLPETGI